MIRELEERLRKVLVDVCPDAAERARLAQLMALFANLPPPPDSGGHLDRYPELHERFLASLVHGDSDLIDDSFLDLYAHIHMHEAPYTSDERRQVDESGGYWCHAGGLSPILKAGTWLNPGSVSMDLGAGNGLQGLLLQKLYPHARTIQVEISSQMVRIGRGLQRWLEIPGDRVEWVVSDVRTASVEGVDFLYLYRPVRPDGPGGSFYIRLAAELDASSRDVVIFSIADCLRDFLSPRFEAFYSDGHLTCFRRRIENQRTQI
jgi:hypothetical protein